MRSLVPGYLKGPNLHNCRSISQAWPTRHFARDERESRGEGRRKDHHPTKYKEYMTRNFFTILSLQYMYSITSEVQKSVLFLWKRQSLSTTTVLFRTTFTRTIKLNLLRLGMNSRIWARLMTSHDASLLPTLWFWSFLLVFLLGSLAQKCLLIQN